jgi:hypothetical protein
LLTTKKRILIAVPTIALCSTILIGAWYLLPEEYFYVFLICFAVLAINFERFLKKYERRKKVIFMENWLNRNIPGYDLLSAEEKESIKNFSMLWSFFENYVLDTNANANRIQQKMTEWEDNNKLDMNNFIEHKNYFIQRYTENGALNYRYDHLHLRNNDNPQLVQDVLLGNITDTASVLTAILIIVLRYRNNFFHGLKRKYGFQKQLQNINQANSLLAKIIELE